MLSNHIPGRQLIPVDGQAVVHSDMMDVDFVTPNLRERVSLFNRGREGGRIVVEMQGFLSYPASAHLSVVHLPVPFHKLSFPETFTPDQADSVVVTVEPNHLGYDIWYYQDGQIVGFPTQFGQTPKSNKYHYDILFADGYEAVLELTNVAPAQADFQLFLDTYYQPLKNNGIPPSPSYGMTREEVAALGWVDLEATPPVLWDGQPYQPSDNS